MKKPLLAILAAGSWITASEFVRNEVFLKHVWVDHFSRLGLTFATLPPNAILWTVWSFLLAVGISRMLTQCTFIETVGAVWMLGFVLMWICLYNLKVLPLGLLPYAVPFSLLEVTVATWIVLKIQGEPRSMD